MRPYFRFLALLACLGALSAAAEPSRDCAECPAWALVSAGDFEMGSTPEELAEYGVSERFGNREQPRRPVTLPQDFGLGIYPVTRGEFSAFVEETGYAIPSGCTTFDGETSSFAVDPSLSWQNPGFAQDDSHPVVCVARTDAIAYLDWLSERTGEAYRLPTEAQWEYAARAGSAAPQPWAGGLAAACQHVNGADQSRAALPHLPPLLDCDDGYAHTSPAGAFPPNAFGIADQIGNVREWVADCHVETLEQLPANGAAVVLDECERFSLRGASFDYPINQLRSAVRYRYPAETRYPNIGFRIAREHGPPAEVLPEGATGRAITLGPVQGQRHMVVAANPHAASTALEILDAGGSAVDALIAAQLVLNIVEPQSSGIGGGAFVLHWDARRKGLVSYDGRETAPAAAPEDMYLDGDGNPISFAESVPGGRAVAVPAMLRLMEAMHRDHGRLRWARLFEPAIRIAEQGFEVSPRLEQLITMTQDGLRRHASTRAYFLDDDGKPLRAGHLLLSPDMATTLRLLASEGADAFYRGPLAEEIVEAVVGDDEFPGYLSMEDLAAYQVKLREPFCGDYRAYRVCGMGPPSSGGPTVVQTLGILEHFDLRGSGAGSLQAEHLLLEATRLAFADRALYVADPDFTALPGTGLIDPAYLTNRAQLIDPDRAAQSVRAGNPPWRGAVDYAPDDSSPLPGTTHLSIVDARGNAVAMTSTIQAGFGARLMVGGFLLNNEMSNFSFAPARDGIPVANRIEGGKRPLSAMAPTLVFDAQGRLRLLTGSPGGPAIIPYVIRSIVAALDWDMDAQEAVSLPHVITIGPNPFFGEAAFLERGTEAESLADGLEAKGHRVSIQNANSGSHMIQIIDGSLQGGADPRREGVALGR